MINKAKTFFAFGIVLIATLLAGCNSTGVDAGMTGTPMNETFYNPLVNNRMLGDPWVFLHDGYYYYNSPFTGGSGIKIIKSPKLTQLAANDSDETATKIIFRAKSANLVEVWAPEIFFFEGHWYCYFTATQDLAVSIERDTARRIYGIKSVTDDLFGEWEAAVKIELPLDYRAIDATFMNYASKQYIIWSGWPNAINDGYQQNLYITELMNGNPLQVKSLDASARHLIAVPTYEYEVTSVRQNEGPAVGYSPSGVPIIFYSGNYSGDDSYCISYLKLIGDNVTDVNDWHKPNTPLMATDMEYSEVIAPGHCSITKSIDGTEDWMLYHAAKFSGAGWDRVARLQKITWSGDDPIVEHIEKIAAEVTLPAGEIVNRIKYEAELALLSEDCYVIDKTGFASNDKAVSISEQGTIQFDVAVPANGLYAIAIRYSNRDSLETTIDVNINGNNNSIFTPHTQYDDSFSMSWFYNDLYIKREGVNNIIISADSSIYIDCIVIDYLNH